MYGPPPPVRSVRDIIEARLPAIRVRFVRQLAQELGVDESNLSKYMRGERSVPIDQVDEWIRVLQLEGAAAAEFELAVRLEQSDPRVRAYVERQDLALAEARALLELYEERIALLREIVNQISALRRPEPPPADPVDAAT